MSRTGAKILLTTVFIARGTSFLFSKLLMESMSAICSVYLVLILDNLPDKGIKLH